MIYYRETTVAFLPFITKLSPSANATPSTTTLSDDSSYPIVLSPTVRELATSFECN